jgi:MYXO-CTERM domain-containing protein
LPDASSTEGGSGSAGTGGSGTSDSGPMGGASGAAGNRSTGGAGGASGAGASSSDAGGKGGTGAVGGGFDRDASMDDSGIDPDDGLTVTRSGGACVCTLPGGRASTPTGSATVVTLAAMAALLRRRRRRHSRGLRVLERGCRPEPSPVSGGGTIAPGPHR